MTYADDRPPARGFECGRHSEQVYSVLIITVYPRPESSTFVAGQVKVWDMASGTLTHTLEGHNYGILGVWLDDGLQRLVSGGFDADLRIWELEGEGASRCVRIMVGHAGPVVSVEATRDFISSSSFDGTLRIWGYDGKQRACLDAHSGHSSGLSLCNGQIFSGGDDALVKQWDIETEECVRVFEGHDGAVWSVVADAHMLISGATDGSFFVRDRRQAEPVHALESAHEDAIAGIQFDDHKVISGSVDSTVKIWDLRKHDGPVTLQMPLNARCTRLAFDDTRIVTGSLNGGILVLDII